MKAVKKTFYLLSILITITAVSCVKERSEPKINCSALLAAFQENDNMRIKSEIDAYLSDLIPEPSSSDIEGHKENTIQLLSELNKCPEIEAELICYGCLYSYPSQSVILVSFKRNRKKVVELMNIKNSEKMEFVGINNY
jgi:hypothetical protein